MKKENSRTIEDHHHASCCDRYFPYGVAVDHVFKLFGVFQVRKVKEDIKVLALFWILDKG
jgi:hypothetical protein